MQISQQWQLLKLKQHKSRDGCQLRRQLAQNARQAEVMPTEVQREQRSRGRKGRLVESPMNEWRNSLQENSLYCLHNFIDISFVTQLYEGNYVKPVNEYGESTAKVELVKDSQGSLGTKSSSHLIYNLFAFKSLFVHAFHLWQQMRGHQRVRQVNEQLCRQLSCLWLKIH